AAVAMVLGSGQLRPVLAGLWILAVALAAGARLLRVFRAAPPESSSESAVFALPSGLLLLALISLALAAIGLLAPAWLLGTPPARTLAQAPPIRRSLREFP